MARSALNAAGFATRGQFRQLAMEMRSSLENPQTPLSFPAEWLLDIFNGGRTDSGVRVSPLSAMQTDTVFACVRILSDAMASLPLHVMQHIEKAGERVGKKIAHKHAMYPLLNAEQMPK